MDNNGKSFEQQLGQYFKEDNIELKNKTVEEMLVERRLNHDAAARAAKFGEKFKKKRKQRNNVSKASRKRNRK